MCPNAFKDSAVVRGRGLRPDAVQTQVDETDDGEYRSFNVTNRDNSMRKFSRTDLGEGIDIGGVCLNGVRDHSGRPLDDLCIGVHAKHFVAHFAELISNRHSKSTKPQHENVLGRGRFASAPRTEPAQDALCLHVIQRSVPPRASGTPGCAGGPPARRRR